MGFCLAKVYPQVTSCALVSHGEQLEGWYYHGETVASVASRLREQQAQDLQQRRLREDLKVALEEIG